jgi:hypothetical protein
MVDPGVQHLAEFAQCQTRSKAADADSCTKNKPAGFSRTPAREPHDPWSVTSPICGARKSSWEVATLYVPNPAMVALAPDQETC